MFTYCRAAMLHNNTLPTKKVSHLIQYIAAIASLFSDADYTLFDKDD